MKPQLNSAAIGSLSDTVILMAGTTPDGTQSAFAVSPKTIASDNTESSTLTFTAKDAWGNAVSGIASSLNIEVKDSQNNVPAVGKITVSSISETGTSGVYTATLKGTLADVFSVKPKFNNALVGTLGDSVTLKAGTTPDGTQSAFSVNPGSIVADNVDTSTLTFTAKDVNGNAISGLGSSLSLDVKNSQNAAPVVGKLTVSSITENGTTGVYTATLRGMLADTYTVKPQFNSANIGALNGSVTLTADNTPDGQRSAFSATPVSIEANNTATSTLILNMKDTFGNAISGLAGDLTIEVKDSHGAEPATGKVTISSVTEIATPGTYTATLKGTLAGAYLSLIHI